ncbi:hypothetical protein IT570_03235 [Candidatus Sumerlaeota bacterium]|nr:hypothetical protein [Candidatus Sumerlaeota bacterium]
MNSRILLAASLMLAAGCGSKKAPEKSLLKNPDEVTYVSTSSAVTLNSDKDFQEPRVYDRSNFGLHASGSGNLLLISARNKGDMDVTIFPQDLALITGPDRRRDLMVVNPVTADLSQFTNVTLKPNDRAVIRLPIKLYSNLKGMRLVYNNPRQNILTFVDIQ